MSRSNNNSTNYILDQYKVWEDGNGMDPVGSFVERERERELSKGQTETATVLSLS